MGTDGGVQTDADFRLYFAKSINGVAPASFGTAHAAQGVNQAAAFRRNILGALHVDMGASDDADNLIAYHVFQSKLAQASSTSSELRRDIMLQGEANVTTHGYQTIYVAMELIGAARDFGTAVTLNMGGSANVAADTTGASVALTTTGTDPRLVFQPGDSIVGSTGTVEMEVVSVTDGTNMAVKNIRPLVLVFLVVATVLLIFIDAGAISFVVEDKWTDLLQLVLITVIGAYFGGRSLEKVKK